MGNDKQLKQYQAEQAKIQNQVNAIQIQIQNLQMQLSKLNAEYLKIEGKIEYLTEQKETK
jgi:peptidoglycan hydrolase CwlO-like protein